MNKTIYTITFGLCLTWFATAQAQESVRLGQVVPLSGPLANVGKEIQAATEAAFAQHNKVSRPKIELLSMDDGNNPERSTAAVQTIGAKASAFLSCFGTVGCLAQMKALQPLGIPLLAPIAGAPQLRGRDAPLVFAVRASASEELAHVLEYCKTLGLVKLVVAVQDDGFGQAYSAALQPLLSVYGVEVVKSILIRPQAPDYKSARTELQAAQGQALLLLANSTHSVGVLNAWRETASLPFVFNLSGQANAIFANGLKGYSGAAAFVTVTHSPWDKKIPLQREYQDAMAQAGISNLSYLGFEAYVNARIAIEAIKQSKDRTPTGLKNILGRNIISTGGMQWQFGAQTAPRFTDMALLRTDGTFKH